MGRFLSVVFVALWALSGIAQYGSEEGPYATVSLHLSCQLTTPGTCEQPAEGLVRCRVPAGTEGTLLLTANVARSTHWVDIAAVTLPPWATFAPAPGYGTAQATCSFLPPPEAVGGTFELRFRASTAYAVSAELAVVLEVVPGAAGYRTDDRGRFSLPADRLPDTWVSGTLTRCDTGEPLRGVPVEVELIPEERQRVIGTLMDIGAVRISSPGYGEATVPKGNLRFTSSMDPSGRVQRVIDVGTVCLYPQGEEVIPHGTIMARTDESGKLSVRVPWDPRTIITGTLAICGGEVLADQPVLITPIMEDEGRIVAFDLQVRDQTKRVTEFSRISLLGVTSYVLGEVCFDVVGEGRTCLCKEIKIYKPKIKELCLPTKVERDKKADVTWEEKDEKGAKRTVTLRNVNVEYYELQYTSTFTVYLKCCPRPKGAACKATVRLTPLWFYWPDLVTFKIGDKSYKVLEFDIKEETFSLKSVAKKGVKISDSTAEITHECGRFGKKFTFTVTHRVRLERRLPWDQYRVEKAWRDVEKIRQLKEKLDIALGYRIEVNCEGWGKKLMIKPRGLAKPFEAAAGKWAAYLMVSLDRKDRWAKAKVEWQVGEFRKQKPEWHKATTVTICGAKDCKCE